MKKVITLLCIIMCCSLITIAQHRGIGIRLGEPTGITYKKYLPRNKAVEFGIGSAGPAWHHNYYRNSFDSRNDYNNYKYRAHKVQSIVFFQGRYLLHNDIYIQGMEGKLDWYWGIGGVLKIASVKYTFQEDVPPFNGSDVYSDIDLGPEGIGGMEYTFKDVPLTAFGEVSLMLEIVDRPALRPFSAVGIRYNF